MSVFSVNNPVMWLLFEFSTLSFYTEYPITPKQFKFLWYCMKSSFSFNVLCCVGKKLLINCGPEFIFGIIIWHESWIGLKKSCDWHTDNMDWHLYSNELFSSIQIWTLIFWQTFPWCCLRGLFSWAGVSQWGFVMRKYLSFKNIMWQLNSYGPDFLQLPDKHFKSYCFLDDFYLSQSNK